MSSLLVFDRVYRLEIQPAVSQVGIFSNSLVKYYPSNFLTGFPPPFPLSSVRIYTVCNGGGGCGDWFVCTSYT